MYSKNDGLYHVYCFFASLGYIALEVIKMKNMAYRITIFLLTYGIAREENREVLEYGLYMMLSTLLHMVASIGIGFIFGVPLHVLLFLLSFMLMRKYAGGYHAKSPVACAVLSYGLVIAHIAVVSFVPTLAMIWLALPEAVFSAIIIFRFAPVEHENAPLSDIEKVIYKQRARVYAILLPTISMMLFIFTGNALWLSILNGCFTSALLMLAIFFTGR